MMRTVNVHLFLSVIIVCFCGAQQQVISGPNDVTICEGKGAVFTCVLNSNIRSDDVQWYRFIKDTSTTVMVDPNRENFNIMNHSNGSTTSSSLTITNAIKSYTGYFWVGTPSLNVCNASLTVLASPPALTVHIVKNIEALSIVIQWDAVDDSLHTGYTITWTDDRDLHGADTVDEQTSHTITGLTLDTVYTITVTAANSCGASPEFRTSIIFSKDATDSSIPVAVITPSTTTAYTTTTAVFTTLDTTTNTTTTTPTTTTTNPTTTTTTTPTATATITSTSSSSSTTTTTVTTTTPTATATITSTSSSTTTSASYINSSVMTTATDNTATVTVVTTSVVTIYPSTTTGIGNSNTSPVSRSFSRTTTTTLIISRSSNTAMSVNATGIDPSTATTSIITSPTPSTNGSSLADATNKSGNTGVIAGGVAGGLIVFFIFFIVLYIFCIRKREKAKDDSDELGEKPYKYNSFSRCLTCSNGPHTKDLPSVTNELALPRGEEHTLKDECEQEDKTDQQEEPCSPGGTHRRGSQKHFYTSANHPRDSLASILDDDDDDDNDGSQRTPYLILSPIQDGVQCILSRQRGEYATPPRQITASDEYSIPRRNTISSISPRHAITSDEYSVPRSNSITGRPHHSEDSNSHPCAANDQYSVPRQGDNQYSVPRQSVLTDDSCQGPPDDQYSVPRQSDDLYSVPRQSDDQYSVPRQSDDQYSVPRQSVLTDDSCQGPPDDQYSVPRQSDDQYSVPRQSDDLYSVPRQSVIDDSIASSDTWYATPRQDMMNDANSHQITVNDHNDQCTVSCENAINNSANPHQSSGDDLYSIPRPNSIPHQNLVPDIPRHSPMKNCTSAPGERYVAPRQGMNNNGTVSGQPKVEDEYAVPNSQTNTKAVPHQFRNGDVYAVPFSQVNNDPSITTDENVYFLPSPTSGARDSKTVDDDGYGSLSVPHVNDSDYVNLKNKKKKDKVKYVNSQDLQKLRKKNSAPGHH